jgi:hypothetical protein
VACSSRGRRGSKRPVKQGSGQKARAGGPLVQGAADAGGSPAAKYQAMALQWMKAYLGCVRAAGAAGRQLVLLEWQLLDFMEVGGRCAVRHGGVGVCSTL